MFPTKVLRNKIFFTDFGFDIGADGVFVGAFGNKRISGEFTKLKFLAEGGGGI